MDIHERTVSLKEKIHLLLVDYRNETSLTPDAIQAVPLFTDDGKFVKYQIDIGIRL